MRLHWFAIDTETTGVDPETDSLLEVAMIDQDGFPVETGVHFDGQIPAASKAVHHITEGWASEQPPREQAIKKILDHLYKWPEERRFIVAHNADFDRGFLPELSGEVWICTQRLAKHLYPGLESYGLQYLRYHLDLVTEPHGAPHRAGYDAEVCLDLFEHLFEQLVEREMDLEAQNIQALAHFCYSPIAMTVMPLGKYKGETFETVRRMDVGYLHWMSNKERDDPGTWDPDLVNTVRHWLGQ